MTNERDTFEGNELVTETYRELGVEKAPEHLNQTILKMASDGSGKAGSRNGLFAIWMKPVAWAATIGLSLAIVLELTQVPTAAVRPDTVPPVDSVAEEIIMEDAAAGDVEVFSREAKGKMEAVSAPARLTPSPATTATATPASAPAVSPEVAAAAEKETRLRLSARKRAADSVAADEAMASFALLAEQNDADLAGSCEPEIRLSAKDWLECIDNLRQTGKKEAADREYEAFILEYPGEFQDLEPNK